MGRDRRSIHEQSRRLTAYLADDRVPADDRGMVMLALLVHAVIYLLLTATQAIWVVVMSFRVWRRREAGLIAAVRSGVHKPTLAVLFAAKLIYEITRRLGVATLNQRASEHARQLGKEA